MNEDKPGIGGETFTIKLTSDWFGVRMLAGSRERNKARRSISRMKKAGHRLRDKAAKKFLDGVMYGFESKWLEDFERQWWSNMPIVVEPQTTGVNVMRDLIQARLDKELLIQRDIVHNPNYTHSKPTPSSIPMFGIDPANGRDAQGSLFWIDDAAIPVTMTPEEWFKRCKAQGFGILEKKPEYQELTYEKIAQAVCEVSEKYPHRSEFDFQLQGEGARKILHKAFVKAGEALIKEQPYRRPLIVGTMGDDLDSDAMQEIFMHPENYFTPMNQPEFDDYGQAKEDAQPVPPTTGTPADTADGSNTD